MKVDGWKGSKCHGTEKQVEPLSIPPVKLLQKIALAKELRSAKENSKYAKMFTFQNIQLKNSITDSSYNCTAHLNHVVIFLHWGEWKIEGVSEWKGFKCYCIKKQIELSQIQPSTCM